MFRLTPPTNATFAISVIAIAAGVVAWTGTIDLGSADLAFWLTAGGGILLTLGVLFRKI